MASSPPISRLPDDVLLEVLSHVTGPGRHYGSVAATSQHFRDVPCSDSPILLLSNNLLNECLSFVGNNDYRFVAGTCRWFKRVYEQGRLKTTTWDNVLQSVARAELILEDVDKRHVVRDGEREFYKQVDLRRIFEAAARAGRVDFLNWGFKPEEHDTGLLVLPAIRQGHVNVLEWADAHNVEGVYPDYSEFIAAKYGRINVLDYISQHHKPPKFVFSYRVACGAVCEGQIGVLRWMREQKMLSDLPFACVLPFVYGLDLESISYVEVQILLIAASAYDWIRTVSSGEPVTAPTTTAPKLVDVLYSVIFPAVRIAPLVICICIPLMMPFQDYGTPS